MVVSKTDLGLAVRPWIGIHFPQSVYLENKKGRKQNKKTTNKKKMTNYLRTGKYLAKIK